MKEDKTIIIIVSIFVILILGIVAINWDNITGNSVSEVRQTTYTQPIQRQAPQIQARAVYEPSQLVPDNSLTLLPGYSEANVNTPVTLRLYLRDSAYSGIVGVTADINIMDMVCTASFDSGITSGFNYAFSDLGNYARVLIAPSMANPTANLDMYKDGHTPLATITCTPKTSNVYEMTKSGAMSIVYKSGAENLEAEILFNGATINSGGVLSDKITLLPESQSGSPATIQLFMTSAKSGIIGLTADIVELGRCTAVFDSYISSNFNSVLSNLGDYGRVLIAPSMANPSASLDAYKTGTIPLVTFTCSPSATTYYSRYGAMSIVYQSGSNNIEIPASFIGAEIRTSASGGTGGGGGGGGSAGGGGGGGGGGSSVASTAAPAPTARPGGEYNPSLPYAQPAAAAPAVTQTVTTASPGFWGRAMSWFSGKTPIGWVIIGIIIVIVLAVLFLSKPKEKKQAAVRRF